MNTAEEQIALALAAKNGDGDAMARLIEGNLPFLWSVATNFPHLDAEDLKDLVQEGARGMMHAVAKFNPAKGATFLNYSAHGVRHRMRRWAKRQRIIKLPDRWSGDAFAISQMDAESGSPLTIADVQKEFGVGRVQARRMRVAAADIVSLSGAPHNNGGRNAPAHGDMLGDMIADPSQDVREAVAVADDTRSLEAALLTLTARERECVQRYYGLGDFDRETLAEVGHQVGLSGERVRTLLAEALRKLRRTVML
jgi:RNA polymerase sigma factor (sigma-70 family)